MEFLLLQTVTRSENKIIESSWDVEFLHTKPKLRNNNVNNWIIQQLYVHI